MERRDVFQAIDDDRLDGIVDATDSVEDLNVIHDALFHRCLEIGVQRQTLTRKIEEATYVVTRESMLDERDMRQMSRKALHAYDPKLAIRVYKTQIATMYESFREARKVMQSGAERPEVRIFNSQSYGQTLSTASSDGVPAAAVFTSLARITGDRIEYARIGNDEAYRNLKENQHAVFTAIGPSNDPSKNDFVTIYAVLEEDHTTGELLEQARKRLGNNAISNVMIFTVKEMKLNHLPKPKWG